jgi:hypothetical protein
LIANRWSNFEFQQWFPEILRSDHGTLRRWRSWRLISDPRDCHLFWA